MKKEIFVHQNKRQLQQNKKHIRWILHHEVLGGLGMGWIFPGEDR